MNFGFITPFLINKSVPELHILEQTQVPAMISQLVGIRVKSGKMRIWGIGLFRHSHIINIIASEDKADLMIVVQQIAAFKIQVPGVKLAVVYFVPATVFIGIGITFGKGEIKIQAITAAADIIAAVPAVINRVRETINTGYTNAEITLFRSS